METMNTIGLKFSFLLIIIGGIMWLAIVPGVLLFGIIDVSMAGKVICIGGAVLALIQIIMFYTGKPKGGYGSSPTRGGSSHDYNYTSTYLD